MKAPELLLVNLGALIVYMTIWFAAGRRRGRLDVADTAWGGGFILVAGLSLLAHANSRTLLVWLLVLCWGLRLATHVWRRNTRKGPDPRYVALSAKWPKKHFWTRAYASIFVTQACLILAVSLPITIVSAEAARPLGVRDVAALALWIAGFIIEALADRQLGRFIRQSTNHGRVMRSGLWRYSRHPNYFGELVQWWAIALLAVGPAAGWLGLAGPLLLTYLIVFVSGIPSIEKRQAQKPEYSAYKRQTSMLLPLPPRRSSNPS
jgi:steroid 5-alpha reductase family enzyme